MTTPAGRYFYRRPFLIEARHVDATDWETCQDIARWCGGQIRDLHDFHSTPAGGVICIPSPDGDMFAMDGDWIISNLDGFYPIPPDVFEATYEPFRTEGWGE